MADISESNEIFNESPIELEEPTISLLVKLGMDPQDVSILFSKLKAFSPNYHKKILEYSGLPSEFCSNLISLLEEKNKSNLEEEQDREIQKKVSLEEDVTNMDVQSDSLETIVNQEIQNMGKSLTETAGIFDRSVEVQLEEKDEEGITEDFSVIESEEKIVNATLDVREDPQITESNLMQERTLLENDSESRKEMQEVLQQIERRFSEMSLEEQEEIMPRYIKLRTFFCKDREGTSFSCVGCLLSNSIDCPLFKP
jgi:hypothetical protein